MIQQNKQCNTEKYKITTFLGGTSVIGVLLMFVAIYNASRELEIIHELDGLHSFVQASLTRHSRKDDSIYGLTNLSSEDYQVQVLENGNVVYNSDSKLRNKFPLDMVELEQSRINMHGGYVEIEDTIYTWTMLPVTATDRHVVLIHNFSKSSPGILAKVYSKRLLIPAIFYIWLMVWVALIIRFLTNRLKKQNEELERMALHDSLTGLANRILLDDRLQKLIDDCRRNQRTFALAVIDLNEFKEVNDTFGHDQGDELLCQFADRVGNVLRAHDTFARIGGDEFILLLSDVDEETSTTMCGRIMTTVSKPYCLRDVEVNIGLSIGIAIFPQHGEESTTLMRNADKAMYTIKNKGGGVNVYAGDQKILNATSSGITTKSA